MTGAFITGTDTGVGKTYFTAYWTSCLRQMGIPALALKPIASGDRSDAETLSRASDNILSLDDINPIHFDSPLAPLTACRKLRQPFPKVTLGRHLADIQSRYPGPFLVEGVGGWRVPLDKDYGIREWAQELNLPVVLVARAGLGTLNHILLTVDSILHSQLPILGIILNLHQTLDDEATRTNPQLIQELTGLPVYLLPSQAQSDPALPLWLNLKR